MDFRKVTYVEAIIYLVLYNLQDCTFKIVRKNSFNDN